MQARWTPRVTVAAVVEQAGSYLMVREQTPVGARWNQPAGHLEPGESPLEACCREVLEETGRVFHPEALLGVYLSRFRSPIDGEDLTYLRLAYLGTCLEADPARRLDDGILEARWVPVEEVRRHASAHRSPLVLQCIDDHQAVLRGERTPLPLDSVFTHPSVQMAGHGGNDRGSSDGR